jgi:hypothetical protein
MTTHPAFEKVDNLKGRSGSSWVELAQEAEKTKQWALAIQYYENAACCFLSSSRSALAMEAARRCAVRGAA